jgi:hypothetical protein
MINNRTMQDPVGAQLPSFETANHLAEAMIISASSSTWPKSADNADVAFWSIRNARIRPLQSKHHDSGAEIT